MKLNLTNLLVIPALFALFSCNSSSTPTPTNPQPPNNNPPAITAGHAFLSFTTNVAINGTTSYASNLQAVNQVSTTEIDDIRAVVITTATANSATANYASLVIDIPNQLSTSGTTNIPVIFGDDGTSTDAAVGFLISLSPVTGGMASRNYSADSGTVNISLLNAAEFVATFSGRLKDEVTGETIMAANGYLNFKF